MPLQGERGLQQLGRQVLAAVTADQAEVLLSCGDSALTRFANNYVHQNVSETHMSLQVRAVLGKKVGVAATDVFTQDGFMEAARRAVALARLQRDNDEFRSLPGPTPIRRVDAFSPRTASFSADERAEAVRLVCEAAARAGLSAAGAFATAANEVAVINSLGVWAYHRDTTADFSTVVMSESASGFAQRFGLDAGAIDVPGLAAEAVDACLRGANPRQIEPGEYDVVLREYAVADFMDYFAYLAFGAQAFLEKRSFLSGRIGERVLGENVSIWDDGLSLDGIPAPFDAEGVARQRVELITNGTAKGVVWDTYYGGMAGRESTGHALPAGLTYGPLPSNLFMAPGDSSLDEMIASTQRGVLVTRFWYTRPVHPLSVTMTGMTRDGTFLIEGGRIVAPVVNLRFTQSYVEALNRVEAISRETALLPLMGGCCRVPAIKVRGWNFTGASEA